MAEDEEIVETEELESADTGDDGDELDEDIEDDDFEDEVFTADGEFSDDEMMMMMMKKKKTMPKLLPNGLQPRPTKMTKTNQIPMMSKRTLTSS